MLRCAVVNERHHSTEATHFARRNVSSVRSLAPAAAQNVQQRCRGTISAPSALMNISEPSCHSWSRTYPCCSSVTLAKLLSVRSIRVHLSSAPLSSKIHRFWCLGAEQQRRRRQKHMKHNQANDRKSLSSTSEKQERIGNRRDPEERPVDERDKKKLREKMLDKTLADSFPTSDPPSSIPDPAEDDSLTE
jgi:hypothetical protein